MCWVSKTLKKRIATKDIKTFKVGDVIDDQLKSYYQDFFYDFNLLYSTNVEPDYIHPYFHYILNGFHSYNFKKCKYFKDKFTNMLSVKSSRIVIDKYYSSASVVECIVPKGTEYYENEYGEIVSNQIIINKILE